VIENARPAHGPLSPLPSSYVLQLTDNPGQGTASQGRQFMRGVYTRQYFISRPRWRKGSRG